MLDKILNIKADPDYTGGGNAEYRSGPLADGKPQRMQNGVKQHDSISFSPAARYLNRINWQIKEVKFSSGDRLQLGFLADGFEFRTEIDILRRQEVNRQHYEIMQFRADRNVTVSLRLSVANRVYELAEEISPIKLRGVPVLFDRSFDLNFLGQMDKYDSPSLPELMDGIEMLLEDEFNSINGAVYSLVYKLSGERLKLSLPSKDKLLSEAEIIIEKYKAVNDR